MIAWIFAQGKADIARPAQAENVLVVLRHEEDMLTPSKV